MVQYPKDKGWEGVEWTDMYQDRDKWRALVNMAMNLRGKLAKELSGSQTRQWVV